MPEKETTASKVSFEDFTNATLNSIMRALDTHAASTNPLIRNPHIILGIIWTPQIQQELQAQATKKIG